MPWHLPEDLKHFKKVTMGCPIVMGRKTFESIGRPLPGRKNIVLTRDRNFQAEGVEIHHDSDELLAGMHDANCDKFFVIGGSQIYDLFLEQADRLFITQIDADISGDTYFPEIDRSTFECIESTGGVSDKSPHLQYEFQVYSRK